MNEKFEVGQWVRVTLAEQRSMIDNGLHSADIPALNQAEWTGVIGSYQEYPSANDYRVDFSSGIRMWFNADMLELAAAPVQADPRDAQIKQLQGEVERLTKERDIAYTALDDVAKALDGLAKQFVDAGIVPQSALDEFHRDMSVYAPLLKAAREALQDKEV